ncbi:MAG: hypothetical protein IJM02_03835 [Clostridia bacterium]|nr:hypothetical protein [Clostridia bacterium]
MPADNKPTVDFNKAKQKALTKKILRKLRIPIAILCVLLIICISLAAAGETRRSNLADSFRAIPASFGESRGYPYNSGDLSMSKVLLVGDKPMTVTETGVKVLSQDADELLSLHLDWSDTKAVSYNGRAVVFSNTSGKYYLISRTKVLATLNEDGTIVTACLAKNGSVASSSTTDSVQSVVKVYNTRQALEFQLNCDRDYVSSLSLSPNGKKVLISSVNAENAKLYSTVSLYNVKKTQPKFEVKIDGTAVLKTVYASANKFVAIGDNKTVILNAKGKTVSEITYADNALFAVDSDTHGNTMLCYKEFGGSKIKVVTIPSSGKRTHEFEIDYTPSSFDFRNSRIAASLGSGVTVYTLSGNVREEYECANNVSTVLIGGNGIFTLETGSVCKYRN